MPWRLKQSRRVALTHVVAPELSRTQHAPLGGGGGVQVLASHVVLSPRYKPCRLKQSIRVATTHVTAPAASRTQHAPVVWALAVAAVIPRANTEVRQHRIPLIEVPFRSITQIS